MVLKSFKLNNDNPKLILLGNSNVGKSSITRRLLKNKSLTKGKIGKHAGSTVKLNLYDDINLPYQVIDLPGFGAMTRTSKELKNKIQDNIITFVENNKDTIFLSLVVLNATRILDELDKWYFKRKDTIPLSFEFIQWLNEIKIPSILIINKIDKMKKFELKKISDQINEVLISLNIELKSVENQSELLTIINISAQTGKNIEKLLDYVNFFFNKKFPYYKENNPDYF